jgi:S-adenosylmethionine synthetase
MLDLLRPSGEKSAAYGHFGRDEPDKSLALKAAA